MAEPENLTDEKPAEPAAQPAPDGAADDAALGVPAEIEEHIAEALDEGDAERARELTEPLHHADVADIIQRMDDDTRRAYIDVIREDFDPDILAELDEAVRDDVMEELGIAETAAAVAEMDLDDAVQIFEELEPDEQQELLEAIPDDDRALIEDALTYPEDSAGRLMQRDLVTVPADWTVGQAIDFMRSAADSEAADDEIELLPEVFYDIYVVDADGRPVGMVTLSSVMRNRRPIRVVDLMEPEMQLIPVTMDQEEVAFLFRQRDLVSAPVIDADGKLVGSITIDDVVDVIHEEHEEDMMRQGGVGEDDLYQAAMSAAWLRSRWLVITLGTSMMGATVIYHFQGTIEKIVALTVMMPVVAALAGNVGTQALTVAVRALATKELSPVNALRNMGKELMVGMATGLVFAVTLGLVAWLLFGNPEIGIVISSAVIITLVVASLWGSTIPLLLQKLKVDPAIASPPFLSTLTDALSFLTILGLATWFLL